MPAIVRTADNDELVEVPTSEDFVKAKKFWIGIGVICAVPLLSAFATAVVWANGQSQQIRDVRFARTQDSLYSGGIPHLVDEVRINTRAIAEMKPNLDSTLTLSHQILHYVSRKP